MHVSVGFNYSVCKICVLIMVVASEEKGNAHIVSSPMAKEFVMYGDRGVN